MSVILLFLTKIIKLYGLYAFFLMFYNIALYLVNIDYISIFIENI